MPLKMTSVETPSLNLTPMVDVVFLLLIFFMVASRFNDDAKEAERRIEINTPQVAKQTNAGFAAIKHVVSFRADGRIYLGESAIPLDALPDRLQTLIKGETNPQVLIRGEDSAKLQRFMEILAACRQAGVRQPMIAYKPLSQDSSVR